MNSPSLGGKGSEDRLEHGEPVSAGLKAAVQRRWTPTFQKLISLALPDDRTKGKVPLASYVMRPFSLNTVSTEHSRLEQHFI